MPSRTTKAVAQSKNNYIPPRLRNIVIGIAFAVLILVGLPGIVPEAIKVAGDVLLFIPEKLGLVQRIRAEDVQVISLGRPVYYLLIEQPGVYDITHRPGSIPGTIAIVPDYTSGKETILALAILLQVAIVVLPLGVVFSSRHRSRRAFEKQVQQRNRETMDRFLNGLRDEGD